jgi:hypothetical protein
LFQKFFAFDIEAHAQMQVEVMELWSNDFLKYVFPKENLWQFYARHPILNFPPSTLLQKK